MKYGLSDKTLASIDSIVHKYPGIKQVVLYGSRAKMNFRKGSDIDLSFKTDNTFTHSDLLHIASDFDDSDMPYFVDVSIYSKISNTDLKAHIDRVGKVLFSNMTDKQVQYYVLCVSAFSNKKKLDQRDAYNYLYDYKGIDFLIECYDAEHTLSLDDAVDDLTKVCKNNGGSIE